MGKRITLTRKGFREWLEGKPGEEVVGTARSDLRCPLAFYLSDTFQQHSKVGYGRIIVGTHCTRRLSRWVERFICKIDKVPNPITARQALAVLDGKEAKA